MNMNETMRGKFGGSQFLDRLNRREKILIHSYKYLFNFIVSLTPNKTSTSTLPASRHCKIRLHSSSILQCLDMLANFLEECRLKSL